MSLDPTVRRANIDGSLRQYVSDNLNSTFASGDGIDFGGGEHFDDTARAEWLQVRVLSAATPRNLWSPRLRDGGYAREMFHVLALNIFVRPGKQGTANSLRLQTLRDTVVNYFLPGTRIAVKDYAGDSTTIGYLFCDDIPVDQLSGVVEQEQELLQWSLTISMRWSEQWVTA